MNTDTKFGEVELALCESQVEKVNDMLWEVQIKVYPDSVRMSNNEVLDACYESPPGLEGSLRYWDEHESVMWDESDRRHMRSQFAKDVIARHKYDVSRAIAFTIQYPCGVFYKCCRKPDGTYRYMGFRYGFEDSQYQSGFGRY